MDLKYYLGCSGWSYDGWKGPFYPKDLDNRHWLSYYSHIFDFVEIDSTFYRIPSKFMVNNWDKRTPDNFKFAVKFPKVITHDKRLKDVEKDIERFYDVMEPLHDKISSIFDSVTSIFTDCRRARFNKEFTISIRSIF